jgi:hypothetical protein
LAVNRIAAFALAPAFAGAAAGCEYVAGIQDISWSPEAGAPGGSASTLGEGAEPMGEASSPGYEDQDASAASFDSPSAISDTTVSDSALMNGGGDAFAASETSGVSDASAEASDVAASETNSTSDAPLDVASGSESGAMNCGNYLPRGTWAMNPGTAVSDNTCGADGYVNMFDGLLTTRWSTGRFQVASPAEWLQIDLGCAQTFSEIVLDATNDANDYPRGYAVQASIDGTTWGQVAAGAASTARTTIAFASTVARFIKVTQTGSASGNFWSVDELNVCGTTSGSCPGTPTPLSRAGWATQPGTTASDNTATVGNMFDGSLATHWTTGRAQTTSPAEWVEVDMGLSQAFSQILLENFSDCTDYPRGYAVEVSPDNMTWTQVATGGGNLPFTRIPFPKATARYIKITQTSTSPMWFWSIDELFIYP